MSRGSRKWVVAMTEGGRDVGWGALAGPAGFCLAPLWKRMLGKFRHDLLYSWRRAARTPSAECGYSPGSPDYEDYMRIVGRSDARGQRS
jgi:hypothetical protein